MPCPNVKECACPKTSCPNHKKCCACVIIIFCGLRRGELTNLEWSDVDFEKETISISKQLQYLPEFGIYEMESAKTDAGNRTISIPTNLTDLLKEYKLWQNKEKGKWDDKWVETNKLFTKENGELIFPHTPPHSGLTNLSSGVISRP